MVSVTRGGPIGRKIGFRIQDEIGFQGEKIWAEIVDGRIIGERRFETWKGPPPVDIIDNRNRAWQVKTISDPRKRVSFSGALRPVKGVRRGKRGKTGRLRKMYVQTPEDKLRRIRAWVESKGWEPWLVVTLLDEVNNTATYYARQGVGNWSIAEMIPVGALDNNTGQFVAFEDVERLGIGITSQKVKTRYPEVPDFLLPEGEVIIEGPFRRPGVGVHRYRRRR